MPQPQSPTTSHAPFARSRPAAVALLVLLVALSARETPPRNDPADAGWPEVTAGEREAALVATPGVLVHAIAEPLSDVAPSGPAGYPHPVEYLTMEVEGAPTPLAFMDVSPTGPVNGRAVLILHDRGEAGDAWSSAIAALSADGYRVIVPDQVGHGLSGGAGHELPAETLAAQAAILLDSIGAPRVAVVGDGLGAEVAVRLAGTNAGLVDRMVLLPEGSAAALAGVTLHDPVRGRRVPVLAVTGEERLDSLLLGFLGL